MAMLLWDSDSYVVVDMCIVHMEIQEGSRSILCVQSRYECSGDWDYKYCENSLLLYMYMIVLFDIS